MKKFATLFRALRGILLVGLLTVSLIFNVALLTSNFVLGAVSGALSAITGTRSLVVSQADEIAALNAKLLARRQIQIELRGEVADISTELAAEKTAGLASRQALSDLRNELAETTSRLAVNRAQLVASRRSQQELRSAVAELTLDLKSTKGSLSELRKATSDTAGRIGARSLTASKRELAVMPARAIPFFGTTFIVGMTALDLHDFCQTMIDLKDLQQLLDPNPQIEEDQLTVCNLEVPSRQDIWDAAKTSPAKAWNAARAAMPTGEDFQALELPDFEWSELGESVVSTSIGWAGLTSDAVGEKFDQLNKWWNE